MGHDQSRGIAVQSFSQVPPPKCPVYKGGMLKEDGAQPYFQGGKWYCPPPSLCDGVGNPTRIGNRWHCISEKSDLYDDCQPGYVETIKYFEDGNQMKLCTRITNTKNPYYVNNYEICEKPGYKAVSRKIGKPPINTLSHKCVKITDPSDPYYLEN